MGIILRREAKTGLVFQAHVPGAWITWKDERVVTGAAHPDDLVKAPPVAETRFTQQGDIGNQCGVDTPVPEKVGQNPFVGAEGRPALLCVCESVTAGPPASARGKRRQVFGEMVVEHDAFGSEPVEVGRLDPGIAVGTDKAEVQAVADDDDDVHESIRLGGVNSRQLLSLPGNYPTARRRRCRQCCW